MKKFLAVLALMAGGVAAAPVVTASVSSSYSGASGVASTPSCVVGDVLLVVVAAREIGGSANQFSTSDAGWVPDAHNGAAQDVAVGVFSKVADGSETSINLSTPASVNAAAVAMCVSGASSVKSKTASGNSASPNPPVRTAVGAADRLMSAACATPDAPVSLPFGYGFPLSAANDVDLTLSFKSIFGEGDDPGPYSLSVAGKWRCVTLNIY